MTALLQKL